MDQAIRVEGLTKEFGWRRRLKAVDNISFEVQRGEVFGFLGPNGAGKTTTIRMLIDLIRPNAGQVFILGQNNKPEVLHRVGAQVEGANFYPFLTGRHNLQVLAQTIGLTNYEQRMDMLLAQVGMAERSKRRVRGYSTGMKQRLGLAAAMLHDPELVILDEPTNGLDPAGIQEIRYFIRSLAEEQNKTVFLSSHLLNEVEQVCDRVAIINRGQIIQMGSVSEMLEKETYIRVEAEPHEQALAILRQQSWNVREADRRLLVETTRQDAPRIAELLVNAGVQIYAIAPQRRSLEEYFLEVTRR